MAALRKVINFQAHRHVARVRGHLRVGALAFAGVAASLSLGACFRGGELTEKEAPPGEYGGPCIDGLCNVGQCVSGLICYDAQDPCKGVYCGGNGTCFQDLDNLNVPVCVCDPGYENTTYAFFCIPGSG